MKLILILTSLITAICSCSDSVPNHRNDFSKITLVENQKGIAVTESVDHISEGVYPIRFIGGYSDSIILDKPNRKFFNRGFPNSKTISSNSIEVFIDTTQILGRFVYGNKKRNSFPVFIKNTGNMDLLISSGSVKMLLEAQDSTGNWRLIQRPQFKQCGTGMIFHHFIPKDNFLITDCRLFRGDFKTKMRLVYYFQPRNDFQKNNKFYSNEFIGKMNYSQFFMSPNDEFGIRSY